MSTAEPILWVAVKAQQVEQVQELLKTANKTDICWQNPNEGISTLS